MTDDSESVGEGIASLAADMLCLDMRFLASVVLSLKIEVAPGDGPPSCDGRTMLFREDRIVSDYRACRSLPARQMAHSAFHLLLGHCGEQISDSLSLAEDMVVEYVLDSLDTPHTSVPGRDDRMYSCERIFKLAGSPMPRLMEEHVLSMSGWKRAMHEDMYRRDDPRIRAPEDLGRWAETAQQAMTEMEGFVRKAGNGSDALLSVLRIRNRRRYDYRAFLRKFMVRKGTVREDPDEFDPIYYSYGLATYGNVPLVDSLESSERPMLDEFVIAIDTSGSTMRGQIVRFLEEAFSALRQSGSGERSRIHVIQCDEMIRRDDVIGSEADMSALARDFRLEGGGGTDFRPVFRYVDELVRSGELRGLKGLMYFTDGIGTYPEKRPGYDTAFVFCDDRCREREIPPWAMRLDIQTEDLAKEG
ncbi:MAG: hypothetical protein IKQ60_01565 [Candidatus Methanomethylophilaceae archaeon]|nr:hypothetical protein [Candidatus Methanomethylophilaceae archaeon]